MAGRQISIYVTRDEREAFDAYARSLGLDVAGLASLVVRRGLSRPPSDGIVRSTMDSGGIRMKITLHDGAGDVRPRLEAHAAACSLSLSAAGALMVRQELKERWLERAINLHDSG